MRGGPVFAFDTKLPSASCADGHPATKVGGDPLTAHTLLFVEAFPKMMFAVKPGNDDLNSAPPFAGRYPSHQPVEGAVGCGPAADSVCTEIVASGESIHRRIAMPAVLAAERRCTGKRRGADAAGGGAHDLPRARRRDDCRSRVARRRGLARRRRGDHHRRKRRRDLLALRARRAARASRGGRHLTRKNLPYRSTPCPARIASARRQRRLSGGGCAYRHTHQGPGIRCLLEGGIRIDTAGARPRTAPAAPGTRAGPSRVRAGGRSASRFIRG